MTRKRRATPTPDPSGNVALVLVSRIGTAERIPPGTETTACSRCSAPCWITQEARQVCRLAHAKRLPLCQVCARRMAPLLRRHSTP